MTWNRRLADWRWGGSWARGVLLVDLAYFPLILGALLLFNFGRISFVGIVGLSVWLDVASIVADTRTRAKWRRRRDG